MPEIHDLPESPAAAPPVPDLGEGTGPEPGIHSGVAARRLTEAQLLRELQHLHRTRHDTFLYGSGGALDRHTLRTHELEQEYLHRHPRRHVASGRTRAGARARVGVA
jgi:hypothetical protein